MSNLHSQRLEQVAHGRISPHNRQATHTSCPFGVACGQVPDLANLPHQVLDQHSQNKMRVSEKQDSSCGAHNTAPLRCAAFLGIACSEHNQGLIHRSA